MEQEPWSLKQRDKSDVFAAVALLKLPTEYKSDGRK